MNQKSRWLCNNTMQIHILNGPLGISSKQGHKQVIATSLKKIKESQDF